WPANVTAACAGLTPNPMTAHTVAATTASHRGTRRTEPPLSIRTAFPQGRAHVSWSPVEGSHRRFGICLAPLSGTVSAGLPGRVPTAVREVDDHPEDEPDDEPQPRHRTEERDQPDREHHPDRRYDRH